MNGILICTDLVLQNNLGTPALIDEGCQCYAAINGELARGLGLKFVSRETRKVKGPSAAMRNPASRAWSLSGLGLPDSARRYSHMLSDLESPLILGSPWKKHNKVRGPPGKRRYYHGRAGRWISEGRYHEERDHYGELTSLAASIAEDIEKALKTKDHPSIKELEKRLPPEIGDMAPLFCWRETEKFAPHREGIDHRIEPREQPDGSQPALPWGPLYSMSKEELLVLRKELTSYWLRGTSDPATRRLQLRCFCFGSREAD